MFMVLKPAAPKAAPLRNLSDEPIPASVVFAGHHCSIAENSWRDDQPRAECQIDESRRTAHFRHRHDRDRDYERAQRMAAFPGASPGWRRDT